MKFKFLILSCLIVLSNSCTFLKKESASNEIEALTQEVLKKNEGIDIEVKPIPMDKK